MPIRSLARAVGASAAALPTDMHGCVLDFLSIRDLSRGMAVNAMWKATILCRPSRFANLIIGEPCSPAMVRRLIQRAGAIHLRKVIYLDWELMPKPSDAVTIGQEIERLRPTGLHHLDLGNARGAWSASRIVDLAVRLNIRSVAIGIEDIPLPHLPKVIAKATPRDGFVGIHVDGECAMQDCTGCGIRAWCRLCAWCSRRQCLRCCHVGRVRMSECVGCRLVVCSACHPDPDPYTLTFHRLPYCPCHRHGRAVVQDHAFRTAHRYTACELCQATIGAKKRRRGPGPGRRV
jgi:hypothetical protein